LLGNLDESYLKALGYLQRYNKPGNPDLAISVLKAAVEQNPRFALGFATLGEAYRLKFLMDHDPASVEQAFANCRKAVEIDEHLPSVFVTLGVSSCDMGTSYLLPRLVGASRAAELMLTGRIFDAREARAMDLVLDVVPDGTVVDRALETARLIVANAPLAVWMTKETMWQTIDSPSFRHALDKAVVKHLDLFLNLGPFLRRQGFTLRIDGRDREVAGEGCATGQDD